MFLRFVGLEHNKIRHNSYKSGLKCIFKAFLDFEKRFDFKIQHNSELKNGIIYFACFYKTINPA